MRQPRRSVLEPRIYPGRILVMPLVPMRQILDEAAKGDYGVGAFNINNMEQIQAIMQAAQETNSPVTLREARRR